MMALLLQTQIGAFETLKSFEKQRKISTSRTFLPIPLRERSNLQNLIKKGGKQETRPKRMAFPVTRLKPHMHFS